MFMLNMIIQPALNIQNLKILAAHPSKQSIHSLLKPSTEENHSEVKVIHQDAFFTKHCNKHCKNLIVTPSYWVIGFRVE